MRRRRFILLAVLFFALAGCDRRDSFSVDIAIYFLDQGKARVVRETYAYDVNVRADWQDSFDGAKAQFYATGEALVLRTDPTAVFGSYLTQERDAARAMIWAHWSKVVRVRA